MIITTVWSRCAGFPPEPASFLSRITLPGAEDPALPGRNFLPLTSSPLCNRNPSNNPRVEARLVIERRETSTPGETEGERVHFPPTCWPLSAHRGPINLAGRRTQARERVQVYRRLHSSKRLAPIRGESPRTRSQWDTAGRLSVRREG